MLHRRRSVPVPSAPDPGSTPRSPAPARALPGACCGSPGTHSPPGRELSGIPSMAEMESAVEGRTASVLFAGFRALGLFSNEVPHVVRYSALKRRFYVTTCVGKSFHTYDVSDFLHPLPGNQSCPGIVPLSPPTYLGFPFLRPVLRNPSLSLSAHGILVPLHLVHLEASFGGIFWPRSKLLENVQFGGSISVYIPLSM